MSSWAEQFARESARYLRDTYLPRIEAALRELPREDLEWRPHQRAISFGTILRHLEGNVRQWILSGIAGKPDHRDRASEFDETGEVAEELFARLHATVLEAAQFIEGLDEPRLLATHRIQGFEQSGLAAVYHVVEHFSWHTGQAVWIAKARAGDSHEIAFYDDSKINAAKNS